MKKLTSTFIGLALSITPISAEAHNEWHERHGHGNNIAGALIVGGILGALITESTHQRPVVIEQQHQSYPEYPTYHSVITYRYYDHFRGQCDVIDTFDQYNTFVIRKTVCYGG